MTDAKARAIVRADFLLATEPFQSREETRYYLNGLFIEPHPRQGAMIVATDGHLLSCIHDAEAIVTGEPTIWQMAWKATFTGPIRDCMRRKKGQVGRVYAELSRLDRGQSRCRLIWAPDLASIDTAEAVTFFEQCSNDVTGHFWVDGSFPAYRRVVPDMNDAEKFAPEWFNPSYMDKVAGFGNVLSKSFEQSVAAMSVYGVGNGNPQIAFFCGLPGFVVMMPIRGTKLPTRGSALPDWFTDDGKPKLTVVENKPEVKKVA